jgi:probable F420-dependent oxidoreductase
MSVCVDHHALGETGAWLLRHLPLDVLTRAAREVEDLGFGTVWISGGVEPGVFSLVESILDATEHVAVATGVVNIWAETPSSVTAAWHRLEERHPGRLYIGLGISHAPLVEGTLGTAYTKPLAKTAAFLDALDSERDPLPRERRMLGALGPKMLELAAQRTLGTHPYLVSPMNTATARGQVGERALVAPELGVVLNADREAALRVARAELAFYLSLPNYTNNWLRSGFTEDDFADGGSDRLIDALFAVGDLDAIAARVSRHRACGANHVAFQVLGDPPDHVTAYRALARL